MIFDADKQVIVYNRRALKLVPARQKNGTWHFDYAWRHAVSLWSAAKGRSCGLGAAYKPMRASVRNVPNSDYARQWFLTGWDNGPCRAIVRK